MRKLFVIGIPVLLILVVGGYFLSKYYAENNPCSELGRFYNKCVQGEELMGEFKFVRSREDVDISEALVIKPNGAANYISGSNTIKFQLPANDLAFLIDNIKTADIENTLLEEPEELIYKDRYRYEFHYRNRSVFINDEPKRYGEKLEKINGLLVSINSIMSRARTGAFDVE